MVKEQMTSVGCCGDSHEQCDVPCRNIIYIMRNQAWSSPYGFRRLWMSLAQALDRHLHPSRVY